MYGVHMAECLSSARRESALRCCGLEEVHVSRIVIGTAIGSLVIGALAGAYGGILYSRHQFGSDLLTYVQGDSAQQIRNYEKLKELIAAGDHESATDLIDSQLEMARLSAQAAEAAKRD